MIIPDYKYLDRVLPNVLFGVWGQHGAYSDRRTDLIALYAHEEAAWKHAFQAAEHLKRLVAEYDDYRRAEYSLGFPDDVPLDLLKRYNPYDDRPHDTTVYFVTLEFLNVVPDAVGDSHSVIVDSAKGAGIWDTKYVTPWERWKRLRSAAHQYVDPHVYAVCDFCGMLAALTPTLPNPHPPQSVKYECSSCSSSRRRR